MADNARLNQNHLRFDDPDLTKSGVSIAKVMSTMGNRK
jgi:hypothetical protein